MSSTETHLSINNYFICKKFNKIPVRIWIVIMIFWSTFLLSTLASSGIILMGELLEKPNRSKTPFCLRKFDEPEWMNITENNQFTPNVDWSEAVQWQILVAYLYGITIACLLSGMLVEFLGPKQTTLYPLLVAGLFNIFSTYCAQWHWTILFTTRFIIGLASGFIYPALQTLIGKWSPPNEKGLFLMAFMGNSLGASFDWLLIQYTSISIGWWWTFYILTILVLIYCVGFYFLVYSDVEQHRFIKIEEKTFIKSSQGDSVSLKKSMPPFRAILNSTPCRALCILHFGYMWGVYIHLQITPKFMKEYIGVSVLLDILPHTAHFIGGVVFGNLSNMIIKKQLINCTLFSKVCVIFSHIIPSFIMMSFGVVKCSMIVTSIMLILSKFLCGAVACNALRNPSDLSPNFAGAIFAINMIFGEITGFLVPWMAWIILPLSSDILPWKILFLIGGITNFGTAIIYLCFGSAEIQDWNRKE